MEFEKPNFSEIVMGFKVFEPWKMCSFQCSIILKSFFQHWSYLKPYVSCNTIRDCQKSKFRYIVSDFYVNIFNFNEVKNIPNDIYWGNSSNNNGWWTEIDVWLRTRIYRWGQIAIFALIIGITWWDRRTAYTLNTTQAITRVTFEKLTIIKINRSITLVTNRIADNISIRLILSSLRNVCIRKIVKRRHIGGIIRRR